jgi:dTDP-4-dehydrorhamnose reductase
MKPRIAVTGADGQLGSELRALAADYPSFDFIFLSKTDLPVGQEERVQQFFKVQQPVYCINCAAYTAVDKAESEKEMAFLLNAGSVGVLASACAAAHTRLVHLSTDYVFNGSSDVPCKEDDPTDPVNVYGASKRRGEELAMQHDPEAIIIRTSWLYSLYGHNFVKTMLKGMRERDSLNVVDDQVGSPTWAADLASAILRIISGGNWQPGIFHYSNQGRASWYDFAMAIRELIHSPCKIHPIPSAQYPTPARRPHYSLLDKSKIGKTYGIEIPDWRQSLAACMDKMQA